MDDDRSSGELTPSYYSSTLDFLRRLDLSNTEHIEKVFFKRCYCQYALCDAVNRIKVLISVNDNFRFTGMHDKLHTCGREKKSATLLDQVVCKTSRPSPATSIKTEALPTSSSACLRCPSITPTRSNSKDRSGTFSKFSTCTILFGLFVKKPHS